MSWLFSEVILGRKHYFKRNLGSPVKSCPKVSLIFLSESVRRGLILIGWDIMSFSNLRGNIPSILVVNFIYIMI